ncbi:hypothetical protein [Sphingobacterium multivorum]|uniref:hypothetical protein n=1 Tax=Sphingobacterium multivorum TaxID=28454 RepID=UPI0028990A2A|nr:hypothetical protein [Sphingobacterium multivorum]
MNYSEIITNLEYLTVSRLTAVSKIYNIDCSTSNVSRLHKALNKVIKEGKRTIVKTTVDVEHDEVIDMLKAIDEGIKAYKIKYGRSTFPKDLNIYQLIDDFRELNPSQIIRDVLKGKEQNRTKTTESSKTKKGKIDFDKLIENEMKLGLL